MRILAGYNSFSLASYAWIRSAILGMDRFARPIDQERASSFRISFGSKDVAFNSGARSSSGTRSEEHTSELQSLMRISYAVFCLKKKKLNGCVSTCLAYTVCQRDCTYIEHFAPLIACHCAFPHQLVTLSLLLD